MPAPVPEHFDLDKILRGVPAGWSSIKNYVKSDYRFQSTTHGRQRGNKEQTPSPLLIEVGTVLTCSNDTSDLPVNSSLGVITLAPFEDIILTPAVATERAIRVLANILDLPSLQETTSTAFTWP